MPTTYLSILREPLHRRASVPFTQYKAHYEQDLAKLLANSAYWSHWWPMPCKGCYGIRGCTGTAEMEVFIYDRAVETAFSLMRHILRNFTLIACRHKHVHELLECRQTCLPRSMSEAGPIG